MGLALLSNLEAHDLGYLSGGQLLDRTARAIESMEQMEHHRGHFFNWYDTNTRRALRPLYVSTVDSGNLVAHVRVLRSGLLELSAGPVLPAGALDGLRDTLRVLAEQVSPIENPAPGCDRAALESVNRLLLDQTDGLAATAAWLRELGTAALRLAGSFDRQRHPEAAWWANAFDRQVRAFLDDLTEMAPWLAADARPLDGEA
jgi:hypothetical protein